LAAAKQLQGKELSYNNLVDLEAARSLAAEFKNPAAVIIKHNNPCGTAEQETLREAYLKALACDPVSAFGGVLAFNRAVDAATAEEVAKLFVECIAAPGFADRAKEIFAAKKNLRLLELPSGGLEPERELQLKRILGGILVQQPDLGEIKDNDELRTVTKRAPTAPEMHTMRFAWKVAKHVKSNAIVFAKDGATLGVGAGQMSRVDSVKLAVMKAQSSLAGTVVASDAFFPFPDGVEEAARRLSARCRRHSCRRSAWSGHGLHRHASFPALKRGDWSLAIGGREASNLKGPAPLERDCQCRQSEGD
jgi:phosphoribosylaminoimidazolecarboxamide formyltransferase/IMP cyclohydrolase